MNKLVIAILVLLFLLVNSWFYPGKMLAGGEESFSIFNDRNILSLNSVWEEPGTGYANASYLARIPVSYLVTFTRNIGFDLRMAQIWVFYLILISGFISMYLLTKMLLSELRAPSIILWVSPLIYFFNIYSMTQVWGRFLYTSMFLWAYLPLFTLLSIKWMEKTNPYILAAFIFSSLPFALAYHQPANLITLWLPVLIYCAVAISRVRKDLKKVRIFIWKASLLFVLWAIVNVWWIYPLAILSGETFAEKADGVANFHSLQGVSQYFPTKELIFLRQSFLLGPDSQYYGFYSHPVSFILGLIILGAVLYGAFVSRGLRHWKFLMILLFLAWFICKGTNPPIGGAFYELLFSNFPITQVLRNPYEKAGLLIVLPYSIFFCLGVIKVYQKIKSNVKWSIPLIFVSVVVSLVWPMWNGNFLRGINVAVPKSYDDVNNFINMNTKDTRVLILPIFAGDAAKYDWGYNGVEPSEYLFDTPTISRTIRINNIANKKYMDLVDAFDTNQDFTNLLDEMDVRYIIVHNDLALPQNKTVAWKFVQQLKSNSKIRFIKDFRELSLFEYTKAANGIFEVNNGAELSYKKISSTEYQLELKKVKSGDSLVFKETFSPKWYLRIDGQVVEGHSLIYGYANQWRLDKVGEYKARLIYKVWPRD